MSELCFIKHPKVLIPADDLALESFNRWKLGSVIRADYAEMRHGAFFRKWWAMVNFAYQYFADIVPQQEYMGKPVLPDFERFRKDITILAGFYRPVWNVRNELRVEAESLKWASMTEERFTALYESTFQLLLKHVFSKLQMSETQLRIALESLESFG